MKAKKPSKCPVCGKPIVDYREYIDGMIVAVHSVKVELGMFANTSDSCTIASPQPRKERDAREHYLWVLKCAKIAPKKAYQVAKTISAGELFKDLEQRGYVYNETRNKWMRSVKK